MSEEAARSADDELAVAIIGMACRFPGAKDAQTFWSNLVGGVESITMFSREELRARGVRAELLANPDFVPAAPVLEGIEHFDASFFGYAPRDAEMLDPQQRVFLECAWSALENAGYGGANPGSVGVFAGTSVSTYLIFNLMSHPEIALAEDTFPAMVANDRDFLATRVAYHLDLRGPSMDVQSGCSTSLVATHLACQALLGFQCDMAIAGGVSIHMPQRAGYVFQPGGIASPDGHCRAFDEGANGTLFGSGVGVVVLKRLDDAIRDGDTITAIIRGSAINNDGAAKVGFTAPSVEGQAEVIARAHAIAGVSPEDIGYVEAHGTATPLGDSVEVAALTKAFQATSGRTQFCALGSVKTNVGHLDAAAGVAGLIKTTLAVHHGEIPPTLHFSRPNPRLELDKSPFFVNARPAPWPAARSPRRAGVSSIGIGGTNAHVILEEPPPASPSGPSRPWHALLLSAKTPEALDRATQALAQHLESHPDVPLADVAYTLQVGRRSFAHRRAIVCDLERGGEVARALFEPRRILSGTVEGTPRVVAFMFPGSGTQHVGMGAELYRSEPVFRAAFDRCAAILAPRLGADLRDIVHAREGRGGGALTQPSFALPALFTIEYSLAELWRSLGVEPAAMIGHSMGEYVAACLAGVFSLEDALALVAERGRLLGAVRPGAMVSVDLPEASLTPLLDPRLSVAAKNGPESFVIAGEEDAIDAFVRTLDERDIEYVRLPIQVAAHSHLVEPILPAFAAFVRGLRRNRPRLPFISCVTGTWIRDEEAESVEYWVRQLRQTVRFADSIRTLLDDPRWVLLEVGPGRALSSAARQQVGSGSSGKVAVLSSMCLPQEERSEVEFAMTTLARLWLAGVAVPWERLHASGARRRVPLPTYSFERRRFWVDPRPADARLAAPCSVEGAATAPQASGKKPDVADWFYLPSWKRTLWPAPAPGAGEACWLVFVPPEGPLEGLSERLAATGATVVTVRPGGAYRRVREGLYEIDPRSRSAYTTLLEDLARELDRAPTHVLHALSLLEPRRTDDVTAHASDVGFQSLLFLAQSLGELPARNAVHLLVVSSGVQAVTGSERLRPEHATLLGICRVLPREHLNITCKSVDLGGYPDALGPGALGQLVTEAEGEGQSGVIAHRGAHRWEQTFEPVRLERPASAAPRLRSRGVYLVTGGLGGIGLALAEHLARSFEARLVLVGRSALPARDTWAAWCASHGEDDPARRAITKIQAIEALGGEVLALQGDVADAARMAEVLAEARARFGALNGVIHAAGLPPGGLLRTKSLETVESIFRPKVGGTVVLHGLVREPLDFFLVCSTRTAIVGDFGQVDHCAANAFLDAFAQRCAAEGQTHVVSINWDAWRDIGQAATAARAEDFAAYREMLQASGIGTEEGIDIFDRVLSRATPQIVVSTRDLSAVLEEAGRLVQALTGTDAGEAGKARIEAPIEEIERMIADIWKRVLGVERVDSHDSFFDIGGNSLIGLKVIAELKRALGVVLPVVTLFERPTVAALAQLLHQDEGSEATYTDRRTRGARRRERLQRRREDR
ncbi:type I polyketide synthase [Polyangium sp. 6x1]|uniref:type I polyketide synthase n=1 Tax=Polyangium sp. 6x1 TaxID=3042689 RepID=UPI002482DACD|nr:type I polyketide synthase [Polyangium sp. 6x1]MDI1443037.1 SDR family NAD(P)-dependent oxidoreductase [Polyangium sp. 6x1]